MMRVGVHLEALRPGRIGGLEPYVRHLLAAMRQLDAGLTWVLFCGDHNIDSFAGDGVEKHRLSAEDFAALDARALAAHGLDLWFCPLLTLEPASPGLPSVATIPDLQHEVYPEFFTPEILAWRRRHYRRTAENADRILTLSRYSRDQIVDRLGAERRRVVVTYLDAAPAPAGESVGACRERVRERYGLAGDYFFYPGAGWPHKNHRLLFEAFARLKRQRADVPQLVLTGARVEGAIDLAAELSRHGLDDDVRLLGYVPAEDLPGLYALSLATVIPSLFEGFGLPVVEAMACGAPVLTSNVSSLPEVAGDAARLVDPLDTDAIRAALDQLLRDPDERRRLRRLGRQRAAGFSWAETARRTLDLYRRVAAGAET
jgi:glycosyltransferase involved in cell wall biosynthesis